MDNIGETLGSLGLEPERCGVREIAISDYDKIPAIIDEFVEEIVAMGPNPFQGFLSLIVCYPPPSYDIKGGGDFSLLPITGTLTRHDDHHLS